MSKFFTRDMDQPEKPFRPREMPYVFMRALQLFLKSRDAILRDFSVAAAFARKYKFLSSTIERFNSEAQLLVTELAQRNEEIKLSIFIDGIQNLLNSIQLFTLVAIHKDKMLVYDLFSHTTYCGKLGDFYINDKKTKDVSNSENPMHIKEASIIPTSMLICWLLSATVETIHVENIKEFEEILNSLPNLNNYYAREKNTLDLIKLN